METVLNAQIRPAEKVGANLKEDRKNRRIPAVVYGRGIENKPLFIDSVAFSKAYEVAGESTLIDLHIDEEKPVKVVIKDVQRHPLKEAFLHVDLYQVNMKETMEVTIPLEFVGVASAVKDLNGVLVKQMTELRVRCLPGDLVSHIDVDISMLKDFDSIIHVSDIAIPEAFEHDYNPEDVIAIVNKPRTEAELEALDEKVEMDVSQVEKVEKEKKEGEEGEEKADEKSKEKTDEKTEEKK